MSRESDRLTEANRLNAALWVLPLFNPERAKLADRVPLTGDKLSARAAKYLTMSAEYASRRAFDKARYAPLPSNVVPAWTRYSRPTAELDARYFRHLYSHLTTADYLECFAAHAGHVAGCDFVLPAAEQQSLAIAA